MHQQPVHHPAWERLGRQKCVGEKGPFSPEAIILWRNSQKIVSLFFCLTFSVAMVHDGPGSRLIWRVWALASSSSRVRLNSSHPSSIVWAVDVRAKGGWELRGVDRDPSVVFSVLRKGQTVQFFSSQRLTFLTVPNTPQWGTVRNGYPERPTLKMTLLP